MADSEPTHVTVDVDRLRREFHVPVRRPASRSRLGRLLASVRRQPTLTVPALRELSFQAHSGEAIGIVGSNGSGKSTLLRLIAGLDIPTSGEVRATSQPVLLGVDAALVPDLSGEDNARLGLLALGYSPDQVTERLPGVMEVAGIGEAIRRPIKTYSSGMGSRLRFAIATASEPEILLLDEVLSTGDAASLQRAQERMAQVRARAGTVFVVSHAAQVIEETCTRALWINEGLLIQDGPASQVARAYRWWAWNMATGQYATADDLLAKAIARPTTGVAKDNQPKVGGS